MFGDYSPATDDIPTAAGTRLREDTLNKLAPAIVGALVSSGVIQQKISSGPLYQGSVSAFGVTIASAEIDVTSITFNTPTLTFDCVPGGANAVMHVPDLVIDAHVFGTAAGIGYDFNGTVSAKDAEIDTGLDIALGAGGTYAITSRYANVALNGFSWGLSGIPSVLTNIAQSAVQGAIQDQLKNVVQNDLPGALAGALGGLAQPISRTWNGRTVTLDETAEYIAFDDQGFTVSFLANVTAPQSPSAPQVPGSLFLPPPAGQLPTLSNGSGFFATINENAMNRALYSSWQAGFWNITIDDQFLGQFGTSLPFQLNAQLVASFFPQVAGMITPGTATLPIALELDPLMQPVVRVTGQPDLLQLQLGEMHMTVEMDFGGGPVPIMTVALHMLAPVDLGVVNGAFVFAIGANVQFQAELLSTAVPLGGLDVGRFLTFLVPPAIQVATQSIAPIPVPTLQGLSLINMSIAQDGLKGEFATISGDVQ
jgi:hypothetical protein